MRILGIITARGGSIGIKDKNIRLLNGKPLVQYTIEQAKQSKRLTRLILSTDSNSIVNLAKTLKVEVPFIRPSDLSTSESKSIDVVKHALSHLSELGEIYDAVCLLQPTSPYRPQFVIDDAITEFINGEYDSLISIREIPFHYSPYWAFIKSSNSLVKKVIPGQLISRRQDLPVTFHRDGAIYISKTNNLLKENSFISGRTCGFEIKSPELINIDEESDWEIAEKHIK